MKKLITKIKCKIYGHNLSMVDVSKTGNVMKVKCSRCEKFFGMNHTEQAFLSWDCELEKCFISINKRHSKLWPKNMKWLNKNDE